MVATITSENTGSNCYLIEEQKKVLIIDPNQPDKIFRLMESCGWEPQGILLTHEHFDHIEGLEEIRKKYRIPVTASRSCSEGIQDEKRNLSSIYDMFVWYQCGKMWERRHPAFVCGPAENTFEESYEFSWQGHRFFMKKMPGHSAGSAVIGMDDGFLFTGDYMIQGAAVITRFFGGDEKAYRAYTKKYLETIPLGMFIYPGHGQPYIYTKKRSAYEE